MICDTNYYKCFVVHVYTEFMIHDYKEFEMIILVENFYVIEFSCDWNEGILFCCNSFLETT